MFASLVCISLGLISRWQFAARHALDDDELQHLHFAWCIQQGIVPYRDFWDNHTPGLHHVLSALLDSEPPPAAAIGTMRGWMFLAGLPVLLVTFALARAIFSGNVAWMSVAWLSCCEAFIDKSVEIRPDALLSACVVGGLWGGAAAVREVREGRARLAAWAAGCSFGVGFTLSPKVLIPLGAAAVTDVLIACFRRIGARPTDPGATTEQRASAVAEGDRTRVSAHAAWCVAAFVVGFVLPIGAWMLHEWRVGALGAALRDTLIDNVGHLDRFSALLALQTAAPWGFFAAALGGSVVVAARWRCGAGDRGTAALFIVAVGWLVVLAYAVVMPSPYLQSTLLFVPLLAILAARLCAALVGGAVAPPEASDARGEPSHDPRRRAIARLGLVACLLIAVIHPLWRIHAKGEAEAPRLEASLARLDWIHGWTGEDDVVFDGRCAAVFRRHALRHPSLVRGILTAYHRGVLAPTIRDQLRDAGCTVVLRDFRSSELPPDDAAFIADHFVSMNDATGRDEPAYADVWLPGRVFDAAALTRGAPLDAIAAGVYTVRRVPPACDVTIDGRPVGAVVSLEPGRHDVAASSDATRVVIVRQPGQ